MAMLNRIVRGLLIGAALAASASAQAENYPTKNVRVVVPFAAAGPTDVIARIIGQKLADLYGHAFTIENVPGAGGNTGTAQVAKAPADGYTLLVVSTGLHRQPEPLRQGALRSGQGFRAGDADRGVAERAGGQSRACRRNRSRN